MLVPRLASAWRCCPSPKPESHCSHAALSGARASRELDTAGDGPAAGGLPRAGSDSGVGSGSGNASASTDTAHEANESHVVSTRIFG